MNYKENKQTTKQITGGWDQIDVFKYIIFLQKKQTII